jgi:hypothetical protein
LQGIKIHFREFLYNFALKRNKLLCPVSDDKVSFRQTLKITEFFSRFRIGKPHLPHPQVKQPNTILQPETGL